MIGRWEGGVMGGQGMKGGLMTRKCTEGVVERSWVGKGV